MTLRDRTKEERRAGILRLSAEAVCNRLKRLGRLMAIGERPGPLDLEPNPNFLR